MEKRKNTFCKVKLSNKISALESKLKSVYSEYLSSDGLRQLGFLSEIDRVKVKILELQNNLPAAV